MGKVEEKSLTERISGMFADMQDKVKNNTLTDDTVEDVLMKLLGALLEEYMVGSSEVSRLMVKLFENAGNNSDPIMSKLGMVERSGVWAMLNLFKKQRELIQNGKRLEAERSRLQEDSAESDRARDREDTILSGH